MTDRASAPPARTQLERLTDWQLLEEWKAGNERAAAVFIGRYSGMLARFFRNKVKHPEDAKELISESMVGCVAALDRMEERESFGPFMFGIAVNVLRKYVRRQYKRQREQDDFDEVCVGDDPGSSPSGLLAKRSETQLLVRALRKIPLKYQIVLELQFFEELTGPQIAQMLQMPLSTVYTAQSRGKDRLHAMIQTLADDPALAQSTAVGLGTWAKDVRAQIASDRDA